MQYHHCQQKESIGDGLSVGPFIRLPTAVFAEQRHADLPLPAPTPDFTHTGIRTVDPW
jgi:hypothetical protein